MFTIKDNKSKTTKKKRKPLSKQARLNQHKAIAEYYRKKREKQNKRGKETMTITVVSGDMLETISNIIQIDVFNYEEDKYTKEIKLFNVLIRKNKILSRRVLRLSDFNQLVISEGYDNENI